MKPEQLKGSKVQSSKEEYIEMGIPEEWVDPLQKLGYTTIEKLKEIEKPGKLHQEIMGYRKKNKLDIDTVSIEDIFNWLKTE